MLRPPFWPLIAVFGATVLPAGCAKRTTEKAPALETTVRLPDGPAGRKLQAWLGAINSGNRGQIAELRVGDLAAERHTERDLELSSKTGGFHLDRIERSGPTEVLALVREKRSRRRLYLTFVVDGQAPHSITQILMRPADPVPLELDEKMRVEIIQALALELNKTYVFPEKALAMERELSRRHQAGAYQAIADPGDLARLLTEHLQEVTHDKHLRVRAFSGPPPVGPGGRPMRIFGPSERLEGNVAYVEIQTFGALPNASAEIDEVMSAAADADALILDVRSNGGGSPETVARVSSYLFGDQAVHLNSLYWRARKRTEEFYTDPLVPGRKFGPAKPVYVLTSGGTFSAAEEFTYNLQALKRAIIVGETTGGGAHPGGPVQLPHGFMVGIPAGRAINPITKTNWEGTGIRPDVPTAAEAALATAHRLARSRLR